MEEKQKNKYLIEKLNKFYIKRKEIVSLDSDNIVDAILEYKEALPLIHSFPEQDLYFLIHDIGVYDSIPILALASRNQWEYILDIEVWEKDRIEIDSITEWLELCLEANPKQLITWVLKDKLELFEFYFNKTIEVKIREHDQDPSELGESFITIDDKYYFRIRGFDHKKDVSEQDDNIKTKYNIILKFFTKLAEYDHVLYQGFLIESASIIPSEIEEELYRQRNIRLAEKGFQAFEQAIGIYQPHARLYNKVFLKDKDYPLYMIPTYPHNSMLNENFLFNKSLRNISSDSILHQVENEFVGLCNQIISADQIKVRTKKQLNNVVKKVCSYLSIGLETMVNSNTSILNKKEQLSQILNTKIIQKHQLSDIFKIGFKQALQVKWKVDRWC